MISLGKWFKSQNLGIKIVLIVCACFGGLVGLGLVAPSSSRTTKVSDPAASISNISSTTAPATEIQKPTPKVEIKTEEQKSLVGFSTNTKNDSTLALGTTKVVQDGVQGERTVTYKVTYTDGIETHREVMSDVITKAPIDKVLANGTYVAPIVSTPTPAPQPVDGPTARCADGTPSYSAHHQGTCSHHGGVAVWYK